MFRIIGILVTLALIGYLFFAMGNSAEKALNDNLVTAEQKKTLQEATGVDANDPKALQNYALEQAKKLQEIQNQQMEAMPQGQ